MIRKVAYGIIVSIFIVTACSQKEKNMTTMQITTIDDVKKLFPTTPDQIQQEKEECLAQAREQIDNIIEQNDSERTFENTAQKLDDLNARSKLALKDGAFEIMVYLHPDKAMRDAAYKAVQEIQDFSVDHIRNSKKLYNAFKAYVEGNAQTGKLNEEQRYYLEQTMRSFKRAGLDLPDEELEKLRTLKKELAKLTQEFDRNIADDQSTLIVTPESLKGVGADFIAGLPKSDTGECVLGVDYPTYFRVMERCNVEDTRKGLYELFSQRAYPKNEELLKKIVALRDQIAKMVGYESYAHLDLDNQMVGHPERAEQFLNDLLAKSEVKENAELDCFINELPESVCLTHDGKINVWDLAYLKNHYKEKNFSVDEQAISEYFPMQKTIDALLDIYQQFMGVQFKEIPVTGMWHEDVRLVQVYDAADQLLGYLFLDLYPRPNKYSHAAHAGIVPAIKQPDGSRSPAVSVVMANFPKPQNDKPALLMRNDVKTFFHEFGHAVHALLGATQLGSFAGTRTKTDFVELPSQMLEEWLCDADILKKVSCHYKTGEPLADETIKNIIALKQYDSGCFVRRQGMLALISLNLYKEGAQKDPHAVMTSLQETLMPRMHYGSHNHFIASFGHLTGYGSKYYGYLWSKVFALDLFDTIKKQGLLNPAIGRTYVDKVIGCGGSKDPNTLLYDFLGRQPTQDAFLKDMGLS